MSYQYYQQGYNSQQQYVQQQQLQQQQLLLQQQQQQQQRPSPPQQQQQQPLQQQSQYNYSAMEMTTQNVAKEQVEFKTSENTPKEWKFGLFDCFSDLGLCNYCSFTFFNIFIFSLKKKKLIMIR